MYAKGDQLPVVNDVNLINPIGVARRRPADLQHDGQRVDAPGPALQPHSRSAVDRRVRLQVDDAPGDEALRERAPVQRSVFAWKGHRRYAAAHAAHGAVGSRPVRPEQSRARQGPEPARHAPQLHGQRDLHVEQPRLQPDRPRDPERERNRPAAPVQQRPAAEHHREPGSEQGRHQQRPSAVRLPELALPGSAQERRHALHAVDPHRRVVRGDSSSSR